MPMVRRAAAANLGKFAATVEGSYLRSDIMSMFEDLTQDGKVIHFFQLIISMSQSCRLVVIGYTSRPLG